MTDEARRVVRVFIADPDDRIPIIYCLLYKSEEKLTDLTDQELFFEIAIKKILEAHNAERIKIIDKEASDKFGKVINLKPIKIRDLKMTVVTIAEF